MSNYNAWQQVKTTPPGLTGDKDLDAVTTYRLVYVHDSGMFSRTVEGTRAWFEYVRDNLVGKPVPGYGILTHIGAPV